MSSQGRWPASSSDGSPAERGQSRIEEDPCKGRVAAAMALSFAVTWDYRCPFARNAHEHLLTALEAGADWDVNFVPFSLGQVHVGEGETDVWDEPEKDTGLVALQSGTLVRDRHPEQFYAVHRALFAARHDNG